jgi:RNA polymerase sigma factor (sigma-70 family)
MTDEQLLQGCKEKNLNAQKLLYERFAKKMMGVCLRYADSTAEAQDILQDAFIKIFEKMDSYHGTGSLEGWIKKVMVNTALDNFRKNKHERNNIELDVNIASHNSYEESYDSLSAKDLLKIIQKLPIGYRTVFNLFAIEGYSHKEIGEMLGINESTSKSQYSRAKSHLQKAIQLEKIY